MTSDRIGFIGLGNMGGAIAERFADAGAPLTVCDLSPASVEPFRARGVDISLTPREVADKSDIVFTCVASVPASREIALGPDGAIHGSAVKTYVELSTMGSKAIGLIAAGIPASIGFLDAPVSGGPQGARAGTLATMISGPQEHFDRAHEALSIMAKNVFYLGEKPGIAQTAKLINNHLSAAGRLATFEGLVMALKAGLDPRKLIEVINVSTGMNFTTKTKVESGIFSGAFKLSGPLTISVKDHHLLIDEAADLGAPLWLPQHMLKLIEDACEHGYREMDGMNLVQYMGEVAGIDVKAMVSPKEEKPK